MFTEHVFCFPACDDLIEASNMMANDDFNVCTLPPVVTSSESQSPVEVKSPKQSSQSSIRKARWTSEEDDKLCEAVSLYGARNWGKISEFVHSRSGKQCRERWIVHHDPSFTRSSWSSEEDAELLRLWSQFGNKWSKIAKQMNGRSTTNIKNRFKFLNNHNLVSRQPSSAISPVVSEIKTVEYPLDDEYFCTFSSPDCPQEEFTIPYV